MLHAHMRRLARSPGLRRGSVRRARITRSTWARTWMDFTVTSTAFEEMLGYGYNRPPAGRACTGTGSSQRTCLASILAWSRASRTTKQAGRGRMTCSTCHRPPTESTGAAWRRRKIALRGFDDANGRHERSSGMASACATSARAPAINGETMWTSFGSPAPQPPTPLLGPAIHVLRLATRSPSQDGRGLAIAQEKNIATARENKSRATAHRAAYGSKAAQE